MYILGINLSHHASICLYQNEKIVFYLENDRIGKVKEIEFLFGDDMKILDEVLKYTSHIDHVIFCSFGKNRFYENSDDLMIGYIKNKMHDYGVEYDNVHFYNEHHLYHACNAFYSSGFDESAVLVLDGGGVNYKDYLEVKELESMYYFSGLKFDTIKKHYGSRNIFSNDKPVKVDENIILSSTISCGGIFNSFWTITGKEPGKIMGLSSYGDSKKLETEEWFLYDENTKSWYTNNNKILECYVKYTGDPYLDPMCGDPVNKFKKVFSENFEYEIIANIAKKIQEETKEQTIKLIEQILKKCQTKNIVLSGGYMLNCVNNYEYLKYFPDINFYIDPVAHDGGTVIGAVKYLWHHILNHKEKETLKTLYLG